MSNSIPNETILIDDRDPSCINKKIKGLIHQKNLVYKKKLKENNSDNQRAFLQIQDQVRLSTENSKLKYYQKLSNKLSNDTFKGKCYWSILKNVLNSKRILRIPPLIHDNKFVTDFHLKREIFSLHFLLTNANDFLLRLSVVKFFENDILSVIRNLDSSKALGHNKISIRMLKLCDKTIYRPLHLIYTSCLDYWAFLSLSKMANFVSIHKKES